MGSTQWREYLVDLTASEIKQINVKGKANMIIVRNPDSANVIHMDLNPTIGVSADYESTAPFDGWGFLIRPFEIKQAYLISSASISKVRVYEVYTENPLQLIQNMAQAPTGAVQVTATVGIKPGDLSIEAGTKHLNVDVQNMPSLPAGGNNIGSVDVASLPALPAGDNNIGNVDVVTLPALPAGDNNIGNVDIASALPAGTNNIGDVDIASALPAGDNNIGNVDIVTVAAGQNVKPGTTCTIYNVTMTNANTEYSQALPAAVARKLSMSVLTNDAAFRVAFVANKVAAPTAPYLNIASGGAYQNDNIELAASTTVYFASPTAGKVMQIEVWT